MTPGDDGSGTAPYVVRPYRGFGLFCAVAVALAGAARLPADLHRGRGWGVVAGVVLLVVAVLLAAEALVARVTWDGSVLRRHDLGRSRAVRRADVGTALLVPSYRRRRRGEPSPLLVFLDPGGRALLRLGGGMWREEEVVDLAEAVAGGAVERVDGTTGVAELERRYPAALTLLERHRKVVFALWCLYVVVIVANLVNSWR